jgi:predicted secreted protein with PEFG-CTERM motif
VKLESNNQWDQIDFSRQSQHWQGGRSDGQAANESISPRIFSGNNEFTLTKPSVKTLPDTEPKPERFDNHGKWCISLEDAKSQAKKWGLDIGRAPLCSNSEKDVEEAITVDNVRAARSVNVDNVLVIINKLDNQTDFENPTDKQELIGDLEKIRNYVLTDQMPEALEGYINFADSVTVKVTSETGQQQILKVVDRNITSTSHALPEFETLSILILIVSIITIIGISRKMRGVFVQLTPILRNDVSK